MKYFILSVIASMCLMVEGSTFADDAREEEQIAMNLLSAHGCNMCHSMIDNGTGSSYLNIARRNNRIFGAKSKLVALMFKNDVPGKRWGDRDLAILKWERCAECEPLTQEERNGYFISNEKVSSKAEMSAMITFILNLNESHPIVQGEIAVRKTAEAARKFDGDDSPLRIKLEPFTVLLADGNYLQTTIALLLTKSSEKRVIQNFQSKIRSSILTLLTSKSVSQISGENGKSKLGKEIRNVVNYILHDKATVKEVSFGIFDTQ